MYSIGNNLVKTAKYFSKRYSIAKFVMRIEVIYMSFISNQDMYILFYLESEREIRKILRNIKKKNLGKEINSFVLIIFSFKKKTS